LCVIKASGDEELATLFSKQHDEKVEKERGKM
jgi:hypothetical protein